MAPERTQPEVLSPQLAQDDHFTPEVGPSANEDGRPPPSRPARGFLRRSSADDAELVVRLVQCPLCNRPLLWPVTLPCGRSLCRKCLPTARARTNISYLSSPSRLPGFDCPFDGCSMEHASEDCGIDVTLSRVVASLTGALERLVAPGELADSAPDRSRGLFQPDSEPEPKFESRLEPELEPEVATTPERNKTMGVQTISLDEEDDSRCALKQPSNDQEAGERGTNDVIHLEQIGQSTRSEVDCQVCYALFYDAVTTHCGHTFCRHCLHRMLDHSDLCAVCRRVLHRASWPTNKRLSEITTTFWAEALDARREAIRQESRHDASEFDHPLFVCTLSFPTMPTFLHVFEPRYRLMIRRSLEQDRTFGMVLYQRPAVSGGPNFLELGTLLRIRNVEFFPDGRSLLETVGVSRFRVVRHGVMDGYLVGKVERVHDISVAEEENLEATEMRNARTAETRQTDSDRNGNGSIDTVSSGSRTSEGGEGRGASSAPQATRGDGTEEATRLPLTTSDLDGMATRDLLKFGTAFVRRMREGSVVWLTSRMLAVYGECPEDDPVKFPWWFASILPVTDLEKYRLLSTESVRERLKICCRWILEWESTRW